MPLFWPKPTILPSRLGPDPPDRNLGCWVLTIRLFRWTVTPLRSKYRKPCSLFATDLPVFNLMQGRASKKSSAAAQVSQWELHSGKPPICGSGVVVTVPTKSVRLWIDRGRLPNRTAAVSAVCPPLSGTSKVFQRNRAVSSHESYDTAQGATGICGVKCQSFFARRNANVDNAVENNR